MEAVFSTDFPQAPPLMGVVPGNQQKAMPTRKINGVWPYLPPGIERDSTFAQQGTTGRLEKNGAVLLTAPGHNCYLETCPRSGIFVAYNPLPDPSTLRLQLPNDAWIEADGKVALLRLAVQPQAHRLWVDYSEKPNQRGEQMANELVIHGLGEVSAT